MAIPAGITINPIGHGSVNADCYGSCVSPNGASTGAGFQWYDRDTEGGYGAHGGGTTSELHSGALWSPSFTTTYRITGLSPGHNYRARAYFANASGTGFSTTSGNFWDFTTDLVAPTVSLTAAQQGANPYTQIYVEGTPTYDGGGSILSRQLFISTHSDGSSPFASTDLGAGAVGTPFGFTFTGLTNGTTYYVYAIVTNSATAGGTAVTPVGTLAYTAPTVGNTSTPWATTTTTITPKATATSNGSAGDYPITSGGFVYAEYGTNATPTIGGTGVTQVAHGSAPTLNVEFSDALTGLTPGRVYAVRAYATNGIGTAYSSVVQIVTTTFSGFAQSQSIPTPTMRKLYTAVLTGKAETAAIPSPPLSSAHVSGKAETAIVGTITWRMRVNPSGKAETARFGVPVMLRTGVASVTVIQTATSAIGSANTSQNCTVAALTVHSLVVVVVYLGIASAGVSGVTDNASGGSSIYQRAQETHGHYDCELWYCDDAKAGATTITVAHSSATCGIIVREYSGVSAGASLDKATSASADSGASANFSTGNTAITTQNEELVIAAYSYETNV